METIFFLIGIGFGFLAMLYLVKSFFFSKLKTKVKQQDEELKFQHGLIGFLLHTLHCKGLTDDDINELLSNYKED